MDKSQAQFVLRSCRANGADAADPVFAPALDAAARDPELGAWFDREQRMDRAVAARLQQIPVPPDLFSSLLAGLETEPPARQRSLVPLALAASIALLAAIALFWTLRPSPAENFARYRQEMVSRLDGRLVLSFQSDRPADLQRWLADQRGLTGSVIPAGLQARPSIGCRSWTWNGQAAGLICFLLDGGQAVHLFIVPRGAVPRGPDGAEPQFEQVGAWQTASWTQGDLVYVLAGQADRQALARLL